MKNRSNNNNNIGIMLFMFYFLTTMVSGFGTTTRTTKMRQYCGSLTSLTTTMTTTTQRFMVPPKEEEEEEDNAVDFSNFEQELDDISTIIDNVINEDETKETASSPTAVVKEDTTTTNNNNKDNNDQAEKLKQELILLGASYDRGFGASPSARTKAKRIIQDLESCNPETFASRGIDGNNNDDDATGGGSSLSSSPLQGSWRMIWTNAPDVLVLGASPLSNVGAIYQVFDPPLVTNIIDFIPKSQSLLPSIIPPSLIRAKVSTRASSRSDGNAKMRIGLSFEAVELNPVELLGQSVKGVLPPLGIKLPQIPLFANPETSPGYFDVTYLDEELLIIQQSGQGLFALVKVDNNDP